MARLLKGVPAAGALCGTTRNKTEILHAEGISPTLAILRVGAREDDTLYECAAIKRCSALGIGTRVIALPIDAGQAALM
ncbi:MAG TPA: bifunctional 5,10-methylene-tetrahydrofolate dehydrogenase/5,10-methylene-tetrahydrofolate cyclohydrolase, partial [Clostridiales bacterium]|nr:bifunctional 5,10-methylene-tetrahydrofolate dehydrogenase/5,10-methylene-tetrahydrofolate cyclohydrolase [Clostridiales bacterium]